MHDLSSLKNKFNAPLPAGHGIMILPWRDGTTEIFIHNVHRIKYNIDNKIVIIEGGSSEGHANNFVSHMGFDNIADIIKDASLRALRGEIASYEDYNKDGSRKDKTPLIRSAVQGQGKNNKALSL